MRSAMTGVASPTMNSGRKAMPSKTAKPATNLEPQHRRRSGCFLPVFAAGSTLGSGTPREATVAVITKVLKQEKPISSLAFDKISGS
mmetsp:Transcript_36616/g.66385  ORF Transcript_36616/g.66385 Transcript_36616/m.66385 type:complete len:87 (-) Transcript_36616:686-946(-)